MRLLGNIDHVSGGRIEGWVLDEDEPGRRLLVEAISGDRCLGHARADLPRPDVPDRRGRPAHCGYALQLTLPEGAPMPMQVALFLANSDIEAPGSPVTVDASAAPRMIGTIDQVDGQTIRGWALDCVRPEAKLKLVLMVDGRVVGHAVADQFRMDVARAGVGSERCAFEARVPIELCDGRSWSVSIAEEKTGWEVPGSPISFSGVAGGPKSLLAEVSAGDSKRRSKAIALLDRYMAQMERLAPASIGFEEYRSWADLFQELRGAEVETGGRPFPAFLIVLEAGGDLDAAAATCTAIRGTRLKTKVLLEVDPPAWDKAGSRVKSAIKTLPGLSMKDRAAATPQAVLRLIAGRTDVFLLKLAPGARLRPGALEYLAGRIDEQVDLAYGDWQQDGPEGPIPHFLPDWNQHLLLSSDYLGPLVAMRAASLAVEAGESWADVLFRAVEKARPGAIRHIDRVLSEATGPLAAWSRESLARHLARVGLAAKPRPHSSLAHAWSLDFQALRTPPLVSILVPTRDRLDLVRPCIESLLARTDYPALEILVIDNDSAEPATRRWLKEVQRRGVTVLRDERPFNYSALNNEAAVRSRGSIIGLMNNDILLPQETDPRWLRRIVGRLAMPAVGAVGVKLIYPTGMVQHAGVVVGVGGLAENAFKHLRGHEPGYDGRAVLAQEVSAATAAALFLRRSAFEAAGGLDADSFPIAFNDVDLCLKLSRTGLRTVLDPEIVFVHLESASRGTALDSEAAGRDYRERQTLTRRWAAVIARDPHYNVNLNLDGLPYRGLALPPRGWGSRQPAPDGQRPAGRRPARPNRHGTKPDAGHRKT